ncbi:MAG: hypothetical protein IMY75_12020 [Chloroflexi bacterium]|nr:hypothetical protein [Chloroflexota bacterium]
MLAKWWVYPAQTEDHESAMQMLDQQRVEELLYLRNPLLDALLSFQRRPVTAVDFTRCPRTVLRVSFQDFFDDVR